MRRGFMNKKSIVVVFVFSFICSFSLLLELKSNLKMWKPALPHRILCLRELSNLTFEGNEKVLDVGCRDGMIAAEIAKKYVPKGSVFAIDADEQAIALAEEAYTKGTHKNLTFETIDPLEMKYDQIFDVVVSFYHFHELLGDKDKVSLAQKFAKSLKKGGKLLLCMSILNDYPHPFRDALLHVKQLPAFEKYFTEEEKSSICVEQRVVIEVLEQADFSAIKQEITYREVKGWGTLEDFKVWMEMYSNSFDKLLDDNLKQIFVDEFLKKYVELVPLNKDGSVNFALSPLVILAEKK